MSIFQPLPVASSAQETLRMTRAAAEVRELVQEIMSRPVGEGTGISGKAARMLDNMRGATSLKASHYEQLAAALREGKPGPRKGV